MIVQLSLLGVSNELVTHVLFALAKHNEAWWKREREAGREDPSWLSRLRYKRPPVSSVIVLRDAATIMPTMSGGCGELAAMYASWLWSKGRRAELDDARVTNVGWHGRVLVPTGNGSGAMQIWDPERMLPHGP